MYKPLSVSLDSPKDAKSAVVSVLSEEWPLSAKEISSKVNSLNGHSFSYQAVHKALQELGEDAVVSRVESGQYALSFDWLDRLSRYSDEVRSNYSKDSGAFSPGQSVLFFDSAAEVDTFLINAFKKLFDPSDTLVALQWCHFWIPLFFPRQTYVEMKEAIAMADFYSISSADTSVDRWCADYWSKNNLKYRLGVKQASGNDVVVYRDVVMQVFYPLEFRQALDSVYSSANPRDFDFDKFFETVFEEKRRIPVSITRNAALAEQIKKEIMRLWKGE